VKNQQNYHKAFGWYIKAAKQGHGQAKINLEAI